MTQKRNRIVISSLLIVLAYGVYRVGFYRGFQEGSDTVAIRQNTDAHPTPLGSSDPYEVKPSQIKIQGGGGLKPIHVAGLKKLIRYKSEDKDLRLWSVSNAGPGSWREELVLGYFDGTRKDAPIYECGSKDGKSRPYLYYTSQVNCGGPSPVGKETGMHILKKLTDHFHLPVHVCETPEKAVYLSLNFRCEGPDDSMKELLGYVLVTEIQAQ